MAEKLSMKGNSLDQYEDHIDARMQDSKASKQMWQEGEYTVVRGNARTAPGCHDNCGVLMYVKDGKLEKVEGDPENPYNQGRLCPRCLAVTEMVYHKDRLMYPMKRAKEDRGKDKWERITWEEAYEIIHTEIKKSVDKYGPESFALLKGTGRELNGYYQRMSESIGSPNNMLGFLSGFSCYAPRAFSTGLKMGSMFECDYSQFFVDRYDDPRWKHPEVIIIWGNNPLVANSDGTLGHWVVECMKRGSKLITIDPVLTWLASRSEHFIQVRPGTDTALAMAMANVIISEDLYDHDFVENWCVGFEEYAERVKGMSPERAAEICGVDPEVIYQAARMYGKAECAATQWGVALDHTPEGFITGMAVIDLIMLTGNIDKPGSNLVGKPCFGLVQTWTAAKPAYGEAVIGPEDYAKQMNHKYPALQAMGIPSPDMVVDAMITGEPYPIKSAIHFQNNALANCSADPMKCQKGLESLDFVASIDVFMTPTIMACSDVVLPGASFAEKNGLSGHQPYYLGAINRSIEPLGECKTDLDIINDISKLFAPEQNPWECDMDIYNMLLKNVQLDFDGMKERVWAYPLHEYYKYEKGLIRADGQPGFKTTTGKCEFRCDYMELFDLDPLVYYKEPPESPISRPDLAEKYPLVLTSGARKWGFFHSEHRQLPSMRRLHKDPEFLINPKTAKKFGIEDGAWAILENSHGSCKQKARFNPGIREDTISADHGWWFPERGPEDGFYGLYDSNINCLIPLVPGDSGFGSNYKSVLCTVKPIEDRS